MNYYQKNDMMFYQFDENTFTFIEIFNTEIQKRIMKITDNKIFNDTLQRVLNSDFEVTSFELFRDNLEDVKNSIQIMN